MPKVIDLDRIFDITTMAYAQNGFERTATKDIAAKAGVNETTLYRRFGTKGALIRTAITHVLQASPFGQISGAGDLRADLITIVDAYIATFRTYGNVVATLLIEAPRYEELAGVHDVLKPNLLRVAKILEAHQARGHLVPGPPLGLALKLIAPLAMLGLLKNAAMALPSELDGFDSAAIVEEFLTGHGVRPDPG